MKLTKMLNRLAHLPPSRRRQWLAFQRDRLVTATLYASRLRQCGKGTIVQKPLFWTPEFIELGEQVLIWRDCRIEGIDKYGEARFNPMISFGRRVSLQQGCHIVATTDLVIGEDTTISSYVFITDSDHGYMSAGINVLEQPLIINPTSIGRTCFIGSGARILAGTQLGDNCIIGANTVVRGAFPDHSVIAGIPGRIVKRLDTETGSWRKTNPEGQFLQ